jgi:DNA-binding transcriptional LysR family regulator
MEGQKISTRSPINRRWLPLNALRAFDAVGQHLSFTGGAAALSVSQSAMSRHVIGLEELLGKQLFDRYTPKLALTPAGAELLPVVSKCLDRLEQTMNGIRDDTVATRALRIHIPPSLLQQLALPMLRDFHAQHPDVRIDVSSAHVTGLPATNLDMAIVFDRPNVDDRVTDLLSKPFWQAKNCYTSNLRMSRAICSGPPLRVNVGLVLPQKVGWHSTLPSLRHNMRWRPMVFFWAILICLPKNWPMAASSCPSKWPLTTVSVIISNSIPMI